DYKKIRNKIDFEIIYRDEWLNNYARKFYLGPDIKDEKDMTSEIEGQIDSYPEGESIILSLDLEQIERLQEIERPMSINRVKKKWDLDGAEIVSLIYKGLPAYHPNGKQVNPSKTSYLQYILFKASDVKEFEEKIPWISDKNQETLDAKKARKLGQLEREKERWDDSIISSVKIGMWAAGEKNLLRREDVSIKFYEINKEGFESVFEKIWKAIPQEKRNKGGRPKKLEK
nr:hypothetical protein [Desulfobacterales bacterium]